MKDTYTFYGWVGPNGQFDTPRKGETERDSYWRAVYVRQETSPSSAETELNPITRAARALRANEVKPTPRERESDREKREGQEMVRKNMERAIAKQKQSQ